MAIDILSTATERDLLRLLTAMVEADGSSQRSVAKELGISAVFLGDILHGRRGVSATVAERLGYRRVVVFVQGGTE